MKALVLVMLTLGWGCGRKEVIEGTEVDQHLSATQKAALTALPDTFGPGASRAMVPRGMPLIGQLDVKWLHEAGSWRPLIRAMASQSPDDLQQYEALVKSLGFDPFERLEQLVMWSDVRNPELAGGPGTRNGLLAQGKLPMAAVRDMFERETRNMRIRTETAEMEASGDIEMVLLTPMTGAEIETLVGVMARDEVLTEKHRLRFEGREVLLARIGRRTFLTVGWPGGLAIVLSRDARSPADLVADLAARLTAAAAQATPPATAYFQVAFEADSVTIDLPAGDPMAVRVQFSDGALGVERADVDTTVAAWPMVVADAGPTVDELVGQMPALAPLKGELVAALKSSTLTRVPSGQVQAQASIPRATLVALLKQIPWDAL